MTVIKKKNNTFSSKSTLNKRAYYEFSIEKEFEAGIVLQGWEVKSLRAGNVNITYSYVIMRDDEAYLFGSTFQPLSVASLYYSYDKMRNRKLLLNHRELCTVRSYLNSTGYTVVALALYWKNSWAKLKIGIARGKKLYDKRADIKSREWNIDKERIMKNYNH